MGTTSLSERLVTKLAGLGGRKASRRSFLGGATLAGTALAVNPLGWITKPQSAYASVCGPGANCGDGWSAMCCSINSGRNTCPPNTFAGGWWKADRSSFCGGAARYYIDCNALPGKKFTCHCNRSNCDQRYVACNVFRYGQCNTQIKGTTAVVCRQISCTPPWQLYQGRCGTSSATDNNTKYHNAPCLNASNTYPRLVTFPAGPNRMYARGHLGPTGRLVADDRHTELTLHSDGNLALRNERGVVWQTNTGGRAPGGTLTMGYDGRLYLKNKAGQVVWFTRNAGGTGRPYLVITNGGQLQVKASGRVLWTTKTHTP